MKQNIESLNFKNAFYYKTVNRFIVILKIDILRVYKYLSRRIYAWYHINQFQFQSYESLLLVDKEIFKKYAELFYIHLLELSSWQVKLFNVKIIL